MFGFKKPMINSQLKGLMDTSMVVKPHELREEFPTVLFELLGQSQSGTGGEDAGNPISNIELTRENRRYLHLRLMQVTQKFDQDGNIQTSREYFNMEKCTEEHFVGDEEEGGIRRQFWERNRSRAFYCINNKEAFLQGTRDNILAKLDTTYWIVEPVRC